MYTDFQMMIFERTKDFSKKASDLFGDVDPELFDEIEKLEIEEKINQPTG